MFFNPKKFARVMPQNTTSMMMTRYHLLFAKFGSNMYAIVAATKESTVGNHTTFSIQSNHTARNPDLGPNAALTHANIPPALGQPVASSAATNESGMKKKTAPTT